MKKINFEHSFFMYEKKDVYLLAMRLGRRLTEYLGEDIVKLLLDSNNLLKTAKLPYTADHSYKLHCSAKALEGFLEKLIKGKELRKDPEDKIGDVFGKKDEITRKKIKDKRLIAKTKSVWDFCRNDIMHYCPKRRNRYDEFNKYQETLDLIIDLYHDFYGKSVADNEIWNGFTKYVKIKKLSSH